MTTGIFFDLDGTLWDSAKNVARSWNAAFKAHGLSERLTADDMHSVMGMMMEDIENVLIPVSGKNERDAVLADCVRLENEMILREGGELFDGTKEILESLSKEYPLFIISNCQAGYIEAFLKHYGFEAYITDTENPGVTGLDKAGNIRLVAKRHKIDRVIYVGDTAGDFESAKSAGAIFIHAAYGFGDVPEAKYSIADLRNLPEMIRQIPAPCTKHGPEGGHKSALSDDILMRIEKPARYIGHEVNSVVKNKSDVSIRFAMCFPDVYEIGMSHLGMQILYDQFNRRDDVWCERVFSPWVDLDLIMRKENIPLFCLESQDPVRSFDFLGITLQYEMCYTNCLQILELSRIPLLSKDRTGDDPVVIGGGPCAYNPEPVADFFDMFYIGEGETKYDELFSLYEKNREEGGSRLDFLKKAAGIPCIYVPRFYDVSYNENRTVSSITPNTPLAPQRVRKEIVTDLDGAVYPENPVVPFIKATQDRAVLEIQRGCIRGCRFCQAGFVYRPLRERSLDVLKKIADHILASTGYDEISLNSLSSSDYSNLDGLVTYLLDNYRDKHVNISLPSLRIDAFSLDVMSRVQNVKKSSLTFAPEAGSARLRNVINKGLSEEDILGGAKMAFEAGWSRVKLYFMLGLPSETEEDAAAIMDLCEKIACEYDKTNKDKRNGRVQITASASFFVPKPFTPFQWAGMCRSDDYLLRAKAANARKKTLKHGRNIKFNWHEAGISKLEGLFARGDRRLSKTILNAYRRGCLFDSWTECFDGEKWEQALLETDVDLDFYLYRERGEDEIFPWDVIDAGVSKSFLLDEWKRAKEGVVTPNCRERCSSCGAASFGGGVCHARQN